MLKAKSRSLTLFFTLLFCIVSLAVFALSICVLLGCKSPDNAKFQLYSVNGSNIVHAIGKNCASCNFTNSPDRYMFGLSGTCRSQNQTVHCQHQFPNTFNVAATAFADVTTLNGSNASSADVEQYKQYASTTYIHHALVHRYSIAVSAILIASVVLNIIYILLCILVSLSKPSSALAQVLPILVLADSGGQCASVGMVYLIIRKEVVGAYKAVSEISFRNSPVIFELGFWLLVVAAALRVFTLLLSLLFLPSSSRQKSMSLRDVKNVDKEFYANLASKTASTIARLRTAVEIYVENYPNQHIFDEGCMGLLSDARNNETLASLMPGHFNRLSADSFLGRDPTFSYSFPGPVMWRSCPIFRDFKAPDTRNRGVFLIVLKECCHIGGSPYNTSEYRFVSSGQSREGVMARVAQHMSPDYRHESRHRSNFYDTWNSLRAPCVAVYLLAEWDPSSTELANEYSEILLAQAIWQVALQTIPEGYKSDFTRILHERVPGDCDVVSNVWKGCNIMSGIEKRNPDWSSWS